MKLRLQRCPDAQVIQYEGINPYRNRLEYYRIIWPAKVYEKKREREKIFQEHYKIWKQVHNQHQEEKRWNMKSQDTRQQLGIQHTKNESGMKK